MGGACSAWIVVHDRKAVPDAVIWCREQGMKRTVIGAGSRTVFRDGGLASGVIRLGSGFTRAEETEDGWWIGAGMPLSVLASLDGAPESWRPMSFAPGSLGASLVCDEGWDPWITRVRFVSRGREREDDLAAMRAKGGSSILVEAHVRRVPFEASVAPEVPLRSAWFSGPKGEDVDELVRRASLGDTRLRQVAVPGATPHMLVNLGGGTAKDLELLAFVIDRVHMRRAPSSSW